MNIVSKIKTISRACAKHGLSGVLPHLRFAAESFRQKLAYQEWIRNFDTLTDEDRRDIRGQIEEFAQKPLISVLLPVYDVDQKWLRLCIGSVTNQIYQNWELCIADDCSPAPHIRRVLEEFAASDGRIKLVFRAENGHISAASNSALELATGEFTMLLDHDDELSETALFYVAKEVSQHPEVKLIYSDEDLIDQKGRRFGPKFKPDWSRDHFYSGNITTHLSAYRTQIVRLIGGFAVGMEGSQDYDLTLRVVEEISEKHIRHIPRILYHWRVIRGSVAYDPAEKPYAHDAARRAIGAHLKRLGKDAVVEETVHNLHRVRYRLPENLPKVSLILLADEDSEFTKKAVENFRRETDYQNIEIVLVEQTQMRLPAVKSIISENDSEAQKYNRAVAKSDGEILCFADIDLKPLARDWLKEMVSFVIQKEIGAAGARLLYKNETILHGGLIIGINDAVGIAHHRLPYEKDGYLLRAQIINNYSAVSVSCLAVRRELFERCGGFDADNFPGKFFDVDLCLKLLAHDLRIVFTPYAELIQIDERKLLNVQKPASGGELAILMQKWPAYFERDPFHNPNLSKRSEIFAIAEATGKATGAQPSRLP